MNEQRSSDQSSFDERFYNLSLYFIITMEVLTLLEEYYEAHEAAAAEFSSAQFSLTKARRSASGRSALTVSTPFEASSLRPELQAQTVVVVEHDDNDEGEPDLLQEKDGEASGTKNDTHHTKPSPRYTVVNLSEEREKHKENAQQSLTGGSSSNNADGLRQRKGKVEPTAELSATTTTTMTTTQEEEQQKIEDSNNDPVLLLAGMLPPRELRVAQQKATAALQKYIRVANLIVALQNEIMAAEEATASSSAKH